MDIEFYRYSNVDDKLKSEILALQSTEWGECSWGDTPHISFCVCAFINGKLVGYLSIVESNVCFNDKVLAAAGISEMIVDKHYRNEQIGSKMLEKVFSFMRDKMKLDLSIFTCNPKLVPFYTFAGWNKAPNLNFIGGTVQNPMDSKELRLSVMFIAFSNRTKKLFDVDSKGIITASLGENCMW